MKFHVSPLDVLNSKTKVKIIKFLLTHEASMSEREIASVLKVSHMSVNRTMRELADMNFVNFITAGKAHLWRVNRKSYAFKTLSELIKGILSIKEPLKELKKTLSKNLPKPLIRKVVLFGSVVKGIERADSDIDVFVLVRDIQSRRKIESAIDELSNVCLEVYGNRLAPYILTEQEMKQKKNLSIISEVNNGIQIFPKDGHKL
ncbi:MAG TPA: nucleotidyltransferase domain-containing protein [Candidatus Brocadiia bacterium]|nr:nucleotidyltransferase domain-containing protein [Candidatus Brocadiales bacterium]